MQDAAPVQNALNCAGFSGGMHEAFNVIFLYVSDHDTCSKQNWIVNPELAIALAMA